MSSNYSPLLTFLLQSSDLGLDEAYEGAIQLSDVSKYIQVYKDYENKERASLIYFHTRTCMILTRLQVQEPQEHNDEETITLEDFQALESIPEETEKLDYVVQAMVGQLLVKY
jgi:hypothetical protein